MSSNASSTSNSSLGWVRPHFNFTVCALIGNVFSATKFLLLLPLSIIILFLAYQQWRRQQRSFRSTSHSDIFTYHVAALELVWCLGTVISFGGYHFHLPNMMKAGYYLLAMSYPGETFFHILTCVERYLAVVHPVTYLGLRKARGVRIRSISVGCVWLLSFTSGCVIALSDHVLVVVSFVNLVFSLASVSFCSLCVLRVLIRPGPGEGGGDRERVDQAKQRAFFTITAIMGVLLLWFLAFLGSIVAGRFDLLDSGVSCVVRASGFWFSLPSSLVLPLLYLHRTGKLSGCHSKNG